MDRRTFLKLVGAGVVVPSVLAQVKPEPEALPCEDSMQSCDFGSRIDAMVNWHGRLFVACGRRVYWMDGLPINREEYDFADLLTFDACDGFFVEEDKLFWYGSREIWEIVDTQNMNFERMRFRFCLTSRIPVSHYNGRYGYIA